MNGKCGTSLSKVDFGDIMSHIFFHHVSKFIYNFKVGKDGQRIDHPAGNEGHDEGLEVSHCSLWTRGFRVSGIGPLLCVR